jgi:hypothetical protein
VLVDAHQKTGGFQIAPSALPWQENQCSKKWLFQVDLAEVDGWNRQSEKGLFRMNRFKKNQIAIL